MTEKQVLQHEFHFGIPDGAPEWARQFADSLSYAFRSVALRADLVILEGLDANKPTVEGSKRLYYATDTDTWYYDNGTAWKQIDHTTLANVGTNTHAQIDTHLASTSNPHSVTKTQVGLGNVTNDAQLKRADGDFNSFSAKSTPVDADIVLIEDSAASYAKKKVTLSDLIPAGLDTILLEHRVSSGTAGGGQNAGSWDTRTLNTEAFDTGNNCSLSSNQFTLEAGTYEIEANFAFYQSGYWGRVRLYNVSDSAVQTDPSSNDIVSLPGGGSTNYWHQTHCSLKARFTLASQKTMRIESYQSGNNTTVGWGQATSISGTDEIHGWVHLTKVA